MGKMMIKSATGLALMALAVAASAAPEAACDLSALQVAAGYVSFANIVKFLAAGACSIFLGILLYHLRSAFKAVPLAAWKALGYGCVLGLVCSGSWAAPASAPYIQFAGAALGAGALLVLLSDVADVFGMQKKDATAWQASVAAFGALLALWQQNPMVAGVAVAGLMGLMGFCAFSVPGMVGMGFDGKASLWRATFGALAILVPATLWRASFGSMGAIEIFWPAIGWLCSLVASVGLLIASTRFFDSKGAGWYLARNVAMLALGLFCLWAGSTHGMVEMQRVGGTFLAVWLLEKPWDLPAGGVVAYSFFGALSCAAVFFAMQEVAAHPERWSNFLLF